MILFYGDSLMKKIAKYLILWLITGMKQDRPKHFYKRRRPRSKTNQKKQMKPGCDKTLHRVFNRIGKPAGSRFVADPFQVQAIKAIETSDCLVTAPTGSGKTWIAQEVTRRITENKGKIWYATPLKALTNSIYNAFSKTFGQQNVGILTGDIKSNSDAAIIIGTTEILRNQLYDAMYTGHNLECDLVILDEAHYLGDEDRGVVWEEIMIYLPVRIPLLMLSATIGNAALVGRWLTSIRGKHCEIIENRQRPVPLFPLCLHPSGTFFPLLDKAATRNAPKLHKKLLKLTNSKSAFKQRSRQLPPFAEILEVMHHYNLLPAIFFLKSRAECDQAIRLCSGSLLKKQPEKKEKLCQRIQELVQATPHLSNHRHRKYLETTAAASHHSGHLPAWKVVVETLMAEGYLNAMFATSTVAAGVNFPARSVVILNSDRFNGTEFMPLTTSEFHQMTGRAGRRGMDKIGFGIMLPGRYMDLKFIAELTTQPPADVESRININFSMVLNLLLSHSPDQIRVLLKKSFASFQISQGKKKGRTAKKRYGNDMEFLWMDFQDHTDFLTRYAFVTPDGKLTEDGIWASKLRMDAPLLVAQSIRENLLPDDDPALLASMVAAFINEKEFRDDILYTSALPQKLKDCFLSLRKGLKPFAVDLLENGFDAPNLFMQPALMLYQWVYDTPWDELANGSDYAEGDLARLILRTGENLRQISKLEADFPGIARTAALAVEKIEKEPVVIF